MKAAAILGILVFVVAILPASYDSPTLALIFVLFTLVSLYVFFLADTKVDADEQAVWITAPHGVYRMNWADVKSVVISGDVACFYGDNKALAYNLLFGSKGKREFRAYVAWIVQERHIPEGAPAGIRLFDVERLMRRSRVRGWKLF